MKSSIVIALAAVALILSACGQRDAAHASGVNPSVNVSDPVPPAVPPAPPERGPIPPNANAAAPGTNASEAFAKEQLEPLPKQPSKDGPDQHLYVEAQEAAAKAPDTASADAAKRAVLKHGLSKSAS